MRKAAILFALLVALSGCGKTAPSDSTRSSSFNTQDTSSVDSSDQTENSSAVAEAVEKAASEAAASEAAENAASEAAASEAAENAASEAAASEAAEKAASEAAASKAAEQAASEAEAAVKSASELGTNETSPAPAVVEVEVPAKNLTVTGTNFLENVEKLVLRKVNRVREDAGLSALVYDKDLRSAARLRSQELYKANKFEHKRPNGDEWYSVLDVDIPVDYYAAGENLCMTEYNDPNNRSAKSATFWVTQWKESKPHYENMMRSEYTHAGVGIYYIEKNGDVYAYATMIFAKL